jgi:hypothetical protein
LYLEQVLEFAVPEAKERKPLGIFELRRQARSRLPPANHITFNLSVQLCGSGHALRASGVRAAEKPSFLRHQIDSPRKGMLREQPATSWRSGAMLAYYSDGLSRDTRLRHRAGGLYRSAGHAPQYAKIHTISTVAVREKGG